MRSSAEWRTKQFGTRVLRCGMMHNYVLGVEVVLPDGAIISRLSGLLIFVMASLTRHPRAAIIGGKPPFAVALALVLLVVTLFPQITLLLPRHFGY
jgi:TRAP-type C4-dicarboxylate transport system permease large subunit